MSDYFNLNENVKEVRSKFPHFSKLSFKFNKKLLFVLAVTLALPITVLLSQQKQDIRKFASESNVRAKTVGYIVEYKSAPISKSLTRANTVQLNSERIRVETDQLAAQKDILRILSKKDFTQGEKTNDRAKVTGNFKYAINGIALDISAQEAEKLKTSPYVKAVYPDLEIKSLLMDSVSLINADKAWLQKDQNGNQITGKGINVAILDTGINYLHDDLGKTNLVERNFTKVSSDVLPFPSGNVVKQQAFSLNNNRIAYGYDTSIKVISLDNGEAKDYRFGALIGAFQKIAMSDDLVAHTNGSSFYYYDLTGNKHGLLAGFGDNYVGDISVIGRNVLIGTIIDRKLGIHIFNIDTGIKTLIPRVREDNNGIFFKTHGNEVAYLNNTVYDSSDESQCSGKLVAQNIFTLEKREILVSNVYKSIDFDGDRLLYISCKKAGDEGYKLLNINTGEVKVISNSSPANISTLNTPSGAISGNLIYFSTPSGNDLNVYDLVKNRTVKINIFKKSRDAHAEENKICIFSEDSNVYCHIYDPNYDYPYPESLFNQKVVGGYDFVNNDNDPLDDGYHGTHVAAIAGGNGVLRGVAPDAKLYAYRVIGSNGEGSFSTIIAGIDAAVSTRIDNDSNNDISVMNLSLGAYCGSSYSDSCGPNDIASRAIDNATANGIVSIIAAGNSGNFPGTIASPATARTAITVGAVDKSKQIPTFSSVGPVIVNGEVINKPDVVAPGVDICAAGTDIAIGKGAPTCIDNKHIKLYGTSMASPHVAGVAALIKQVHHDWTPEQIKTAIKDTAEDLGLNINTQGSGLVNALSALKLPSPIETPTPTDSPTPTPSETPTLTPTPTPTVTLTPTLTPTLTLTPTPTPIPIQSLKLSPSADAFVKSSAPSTNFGTQTTLETDTGPKEISYFKFNLAPVASKKIIKATLTLKVRDASGAIQTLRRGVNVDWSETGITFNNRTSFEAVISTFNAYPVNGVVQLSLTNAVNLRKGGNLTVGITSGANDKAVFYSKEAAAGNRPRLIIQYQ